MGSSFDLEFDEIEQYRLLLQQNVGFNADARFRTIAHAAAERIAADAAQRAPYVTGTLSRSIFAQTDRTGIAYVQVGAPYAGFVEFGTSKMSPRPFLRPAARAVMPSVRQEAIAVAVGLLGSKAAAIRATKPVRRFTQQTAVQATWRAAS